MKLIKLLVITTISGMLCFSPLLTKAETFVDLYIGLSRGADEGLTFIAPRDKATEEADLSNSFTIGYRIGHWFKDLRWAGIALEASHFKHDICQQDIDRGHLRVTAVSGLLMFRVPLLKRDIYPEGEYLFYGGLGPGIFLTSIKYEIANSKILDMLDYSPEQLIGKYSDRSLDIGLDIRAGIKKMFRGNLSLFFEYRYTQVEPDFEEDVQGNKVRIETELGTHHALIGFSYHYN